MKPQHSKLEEYIQTEFQEHIDYLTKEFKEKNLSIDDGLFKYRVFNKNIISSLENFETTSSFVLRFYINYEDTEFPVDSYADESGFSIGDNSHYQEIFQFMYKSMIFCFYLYNDKIDDTKIPTWRELKEQFAL